MKKLLFLQNRYEMIPDGNCDQILDHILKTDNMMALPEDFADRAAMKAIKRMTMKHSLREFLVYAGVIPGVFITFLSVMYLFSNDNVKKWFDLLLPNITPMIGITLILFFILFSDRVILPQFLLRRRRNNFIIDSKEAPG